MEDIIAIVVIFTLVAGIAYTVSRFVKKHKLEQEREAEASRLAKEESDKYYADLRSKAKVAKVALAKPVKPKSLTQESESDLAYMRDYKLITQRQHDEAIREKRAAESQSSSNLLSDLADIAMIANTVHHWNDNKPHVSNTDSPIDFPKERSVGVSTSESSWGFDDSDSRRSVSSSMDTSPSYSYSSSSSDSSSSYSSSSDSSSSSPSSDW